MTYDDVIEVLERIRGVTFASMDTVTQVKLLGGKKNPMRDRVTKHSSRHRVMLFTNQRSNGYENMVRRRLEREGLPSDFQVAPRPWVPGFPVFPWSNTRDRTTWR